MTVGTVTPEELRELLAQQPPPQLIDVRMPAEFREVHVVGAKNIPLDRLSADELRAASEGNEAPTIYFICKSGKRGQQACEKTRKLGLENVANVKGGTEACVAAGLPVERGKKAISLERQVRIAAGSLVLIGAVLAMTVSVYFAAIPAFVGAGLIFAGVTDTCGMGMLLAKMPWNQA
jgi:rhodanese-related sulfurtransferase